MKIAGKKRLCFSLFFINTSQQRIELCQRLF